MGLFDIFKKKKQEQHHKITAQPETHLCARCKKGITDEESEWIGNHRFCKKCATPPKATSAFKPEQVIVGCFGNVMAIVNGKIFFNNEHISFTQAQMTKTS